MGGERWLCGGDDSTLKMIRRSLLYENLKRTLEAEKTVYEKALRQAES